MALPDGLGLQALKLRELFSEAHVKHRVAELLGVDRLGGVTQFGLNVAGLFASPLMTLIGLLLAGVGVGAAGKAWDDSLAGQEGMVARLARAVAAVSASVPVVVVIDDADQLELDLAVVLVENLIARFDGRVFVVAAVSPGGPLISALTSRAAYGLTEDRVRTVDTDPSMDYQARMDVTAELSPNLPDAAVRRIGERTGTFAEVFAVAAAERLAELDVQADDSAAVMVVDEVIDARVSRAPLSGMAVALAWAGGTLQAGQAERAGRVLEEGGWPGGDGDVIRFDSLVRLADPASPRLAEQVRVLAVSTRQRLAQIVFDTALEIDADPLAGLLEKVVSWQAAHRVRADLQDRTQLVPVQCQLIHGLEALNDPAAAYQVATATFAEYGASHPGQQAPEYDDLSAAVLRLSQQHQPRQMSPLVEATVAVVAARGAAVGLEARIWAAIDLLGQPGQRELGLRLTDQIISELGSRTDLGSVGNRWRLLLAFHTGRAGYSDATQQLLAPILAAASPSEDTDAAQAVLYAVGGPGADTRLQIIGLEAELTALPSDTDDDPLRIHHALAVDYHNLGDYRRALLHGHQELLLRSRVQGADHPFVLENRGRIAYWTGSAGRPAEALQLSVDLLPDLERVLGADHPDALATRVNIAALNQVCGRPAEALRLSRELLPDLTRVLGRYHRDTLINRLNIAGLTGECAHPAEALQLSRDVLPDLARVLGPDDRVTLNARAVIAASTGECGRPAEALELFQQFLPDQERAFGRDHPDLLMTRHNIAFWTANCGHLGEALRLFQELLPDRDRVLGRTHPDSLSTRRNIAQLVAESGDTAEAIRLMQELLPDQERVLGRDHPDTLTTRNNIAFQIGRSGQPDEALRLFPELLADSERVLGRDHPETLIIAINIAGFTESSGHPAEALKLYQAVLPGLERVFGRSHHHTLAVRRNIQRLNTPGTSID